MNAHIFKYEIPLIDGIITIDLPENFTLCHIGNQGHGLYMWCLIDEDAPLTRKCFKIHGTGHPIYDMENILFLKTVVMPNGFVWHIFQCRDK